MIPEDGLAVHLDRVAGTACITVVGELDTATAPRLLGAFHRIGPEARDVVIDAQRLSFVDSAGLRVLISARDLLSRSGAKLHMRNAPRELVRLLELTGLTEVLGVEASTARGGRENEAPAAAY